MGNLQPAPGQMGSNKYAKSHAGNMDGGNSSTASHKWTQLSGVVALMRHLEYTQHIHSSHQTDMGDFRGGAYADESPLHHHHHHHPFLGRHCSQPCSGSRSSAIPHVNIRGRTPPADVSAGLRDPTTTSKIGHLQPLPPGEGCCPPFSRVYWTFWFS